MLAAFASALKTPDLRKKILFTLAMVAIYRLGATVPSPGVSYGAIQVCIDEAGSGNDLFTVLNLFSGGALLRLSVFALGIMPYITASIIVQLLTVVIPRFEQLKKQGQSGQAKLTQYTRYLTIGLASCSRPRSWPWRSTARCSRAARPTTRSSRTRARSR